MARPALIFAASRAVVMVALSVAGATAHQPVSRTYGPWDSSWYLLTARTGYARHLAVVAGHAVQSTHAFFPLFPASVRALTFIPGVSYALAGVLSSTVSGLAAALLVWLLARELWGSRAADGAAACFCLFPASFVFTIPYAEGAMIALAAGCLLALQRQRWLTAGLVAALGTASRPNAIVLVACCAWASAVAIRRRGDWRSLAAPALAPLGFAGFMVFLWARTGSWNTWFTIEHDGWHERFDLGSTWTKLSFFVQHPFHDVNNTLVVLGVAFIAVAAPLLVRWRPPGTVLIYTAGVVGLALASQTLGARPRFVLTAFPLVAVVGAAMWRVWGAERRPPDGRRARPAQIATFAALLALSAGLLAWLTAVTTTTLLATP